MKQNNYEIKFSINPLTKDEIERKKKLVRFYKI